MAAPAERYAPFRKRLDDFIESARRIHEGDVEAVHRTRVASRRLREFVPLLGLDHDTSEKLSQQLTKVTRRLGKVRELDVLSLEVAVDRNGRTCGRARDRERTDRERT